MWTARMHTVQLEIRTNYKELRQFKSLQRIAVIYSWVSVGITIVSKETFRYC